MQDDINKFINVKECDDFSKMNKTDFLKIMSLLDENCLELRTTLNLKDYITFGVELEFEHSSNGKIQKYLSDEDLDWILTHDGSLKNGGEINSPVLRDTISTWKELDDICNVVEKYARIAGRAGGHVHFGTQILGEDINNWFRFLKLWAGYENIIFRFCYGNYLDARKTIGFYAKPVSEKFKCMLLYGDFQREKDVYSLCSYFKSRYQAVNFNKVKGPEYGLNNTIEFRCPNATLQSVVWQNNINLLAKLMLYCKSSNYDNDKVQNRFYDVDELTCNLSYYKEIFLEQSLELCDMIFDNNLDKLYFLKQYLKSFEIGRYDYKGKVKVKKI